MSITVPRINLTTLLWCKLRAKLLQEEEDAYDHKCEEDQQRYEPSVAHEVVQEVLNITFLGS